jgi:hypothetical protein
MYFHSNLFTTGTLLTPRIISLEATTALAYDSDENAYLFATRSALEAVLFISEALFA